ncbi:MAG: LysM domain-containing protein [Pseudonocardiaceae bacterium]
MAASDPTSRYARQPTIAIVAPDGSTRVLGAPRVVPAPPVRGVYTVRAGDRLDLLAHVAAGDSTRWWLLADANPFRDATRLEQPGQAIELPDA